MNAHVIRIAGSAWRPRKGGSVKLVIEVRPGTQTEWVEALEMFKQRPELSVTVVAPKVEPTNTDTIPLSVVLGVLKEPVRPHGSKASVPGLGYDAIGPKADVDCPEPLCALELGHPGGHINPANCPTCGMLAGHKGKCVKKKPNMAGHNLEVFGKKKVAK